MWYLCYLWYLCMADHHMQVNPAADGCWQPITTQEPLSSLLSSSSSSAITSETCHVFRWWWWIKRSIAIFLICSSPTLVAENEPHWPLAPGGWLADTSAMILRGLSRCHLCNLRMVITQWSRISTKMRTMTMIKGAPRCHLLPAWCRTHQYRFHGGNVNIMQQHR